MKQQEKHTEEHPKVFLVWGKQQGNPVQLFISRAASAGQGRGKCLKLGILSTPLLICKPILFRVKKNVTVLCTETRGHCLNFLSILSFLKDENISRVSKEGYSGSAY